MFTARELSDLYAAGKNISELLRHERGEARNTPDIIELSYDLQTGSYVNAMQDPAMREHKQLYAAEIARVVLSLCHPSSVLEAGCGEATTLSGVLAALGREIQAYGFDISWSRVACAARWLAAAQVQKVTLCTGSLLEIPFADDSIDVVYTSHSIEPNGGCEAVILRELFRVTRQFLILLEPGYELASPEARQRMDRHGYCRNLKGTAESLGYRVLAHEAFPHIANPLNPTAITIIAKPQSGKAPGPSIVLACPKTRAPLEDLGGAMFSSEALTVYPVIGGIPCLRAENGILASKYRDMLA